MNEVSIEEKVDRLVTVITNIINIDGTDRITKPKNYNLTELKDAINDIITNTHCTDIIYTLNTDKPYFGVIVDPAMTADNAISIIATDDVVTIDKYKVELDSKLFTIGLTGEEIAAVLLFEISSMMSENSIKEARALVDLYLASEYDTINIRSSANYSQLIIYALKDTLYKVSSITFKEDDEELLTNKCIQDTNLADPLISARDLINKVLFEHGDTVRSPKVSILQWMFTIYKDVRHCFDLATDTLKDAGELTGSIIQKNEAKKTIQALDNINAELVTESSLTKFLNKKNLSAVTEGSLFKDLKKNGLRSIEDALYEYSLLIKNCETEEDAMYILRGINSRLNILEDYLYNEDLSDNERRHWEMVANKYRELRVILTKKKIANKKQYGLYFDYSKLDELDKDTLY